MSAPETQRFGHSVTFAVESLASIGPRLPAAVRARLAVMLRHDAARLIDLAVSMEAEPPARPAPE